MREIEKSLEEIDERIIELWKEFNPSSAYTQGMEDSAGKLFIPSEKNIGSLVKRARELKRKARDKMQKKVLDALIEEMLLDEPQLVMDSILNSIYNHMVKEGIVVDHMKSLMNDSLQALKVTEAKYRNKKVPLGIKLLTLYRLDGVLGILDVVKKNGKDEGLARLCDTLSEEVRRFVSAFDVEGFDHGEFEKVVSIVRREGFELGRERIYQRFIRRAFDYHEKPSELEEKAIAWLEEELQDIKSCIGWLAAKLDCPATYEGVSKKLEEKFSVPAERLVETTKSVRDIISSYVNRKIARMNPRYDTRVVETPTYLTGVIPSAAAGFFDTFTEKPFQLYFVTTDRRRDPMKTLPELINTLVHEEYGHCLHHSNSATGFVSKLRKIALINTTLEGPITEGLSFNREMEFLEALEKLTGKKELQEEEKKFVQLAESYGGIELLAKAYEFQTRRWRVVRFLRVIGDVRLNTGKQGLLEFIDWAHEKTGLQKSSVYYQLVPAHEAIPGYATCYAVVGQEIREMEKMLSDDEDRLMFQTYLCSIGSPARSLYRDMLKRYSSLLKNSRNTSF